MERINDRELLRHLYNMYHIKDMFDTDFFEDLFLVKFKKDEVIQYIGDPVDILYFMVGGRVKVSTIQENGKSRILCFLDDFELLGDIEVFADMDYVNQVTAVKDTYCLGLSMSVYRQVVLEDQTFTKYMAKNLAKIVLSNNVSTSFNLLNALETRVATYVLLSQKADIFSENLTIVAEILSTSYRHLQRILTKFCKSGILQKDGKTYHILDMDRLRELSDESIKKF